MVWSALFTTWVLRSIVSVQRSCERKKWVFYYVGWQSTIGTHVFKMKFWRILLSVHMFYYLDIKSCLDTFKFWQIWDIFCGTKEVSNVQMADGNSIRSEGVTWALMKPRNLMQVPRYPSPRIGPRSKSQRTCTRTRTEASSQPGITIWTPPT